MGVLFFDWIYSTAGEDVWGVVVERSGIVGLEAEKNPLMMEWSALQ